MNHPPKYVKLVNDALELIEYADPNPEVNRRSILSAMKFDKLTIAEKRASESLNLLMDLSISQASILEARSQAAANIDNISELLAYNNAAYMRIMSLISDEIGGR